VGHALSLKDLAHLFCGRVRGKGVDSIADGHPKGTWQGLKLAVLDWARQLSCHWIAILILVAHLGLGTIYSVVVPIWEAYDEDGHYQYARYIATKRALLQPGDPEAEAIWEKFQPPLYYLLAAASISWIDVSDDLRPVHNPFLASGTAGINYAIHPDSEAFPYRGTVLAVHIVRLLSVVISLVGVVSTYLIGLTIAPKRKEIAIGAMAVHAFWPQFLFNGSVITNDVLASAMASVITLVLIRMVRRKSTALQLLTLGCLLGLALLSKLNTIALVPIALLVVIREAATELRGSPLRYKCKWCCGAIAACLPVVLAWRILKRMAYVVIPVIREGDSTAFSKGEVLGLDVLRRALPYAFKTFFASFGWGNLEIAPFIYQVYALLLAVAGIGLLVFLTRRRSSISLTSLALLMAELLAIVALPLVLAAYKHAPFLAPGRFMLPGISAFCVLLCVGWDEVRSFGKAFPSTGVISVAMFLLALVIPFRYIIPAYAKPPALSPADVRDLEHRLSFNFDDKMGLLGYELDTNELKPGKGVKITLYWRALSEMGRDYTVCVHLIGPSGESYGMDCTYPGRGNYATSLWKKDDIVRDRYQVWISRDFPTPSFARIHVAVFRYPEEEYLSLIDSQGRASTERATFGRLKVASSEESIPDVTNAVYYSLHDTIALIGYELSGTPSPGSTLEVKLYWKSLISTDDDYTVFVHFVDRDGRLWAQHDGQPRNNTYPTSLWDEAEIIEDEHELLLPPDLPGGEYRIAVGMYLLETLQRLPVFDEGGSRVRDDQIILEGLATAVQRDVGLLDGVSP